MLNSKNTAALDMKIFWRVYQATRSPGLHNLKMKFRIGATTFEHLCRQVGWIIEIGHDQTCCASVFQSPAEEALRELLARILQQHLSDVCPFDC